MTGSNQQSNSRDQKMLHHIALLKFKKNLPKIKKNLIVQKLLTLQKKIPEIESCYGGSDCTDFKLNRDFTHAVVMAFKTEEDFKIYLAHPAQHELNELLQESIDEVLITSIRD